MIPRLRSPLASVSLLALHGAGGSARRLQSAVLVIHRVHFHFLHALLFCFASFFCSLAVVRVRTSLLSTPPPYDSPCYIYLRRTHSVVSSFFSYCFCLFVVVLCQRLVDKCTSMSQKRNQSSLLCAFTRTLLDLTLSYRCRRDLLSRHVTLDESCAVVAERGNGV